MAETQHAEQVVGTVESRDLRHRVIVVTGQRVAEGPGDDQAVGRDPGRELTVELHLIHAVGVDGRPEQSVPIVEIAVKLAEPHRLPAQPQAARELGGLHHFLRCSGLSLTP